MVRRTELFESNIDAFLFLVEGIEDRYLLFAKTARHQAQQFTIEPEKIENNNNLGGEVEGEICEMCSA